MRASRKLLLASLLLGGTAVTGCNAILGLGDYNIGAGGDAGDGGNIEPDGSSDAADANPDVFVGECTTNAECTAKFTGQGPIHYDASAPDGSDAAAFDAGTFGGITLSDGGVIVPGRCVKPEFKCVRVLSEDCNALYGDYNNDNGVLLGTLFSTTGSQGPTNIPRQNAAVMAADEINSIAQGIPGPDGGARPISVVSCDEANLVRAGTHLADELHVPGVVGPNTSQDTIDLTQKVSAQGGMFLVTPTGVASSIADLQDNNLTWRDVPNDAVRAPLMINQINAIETAMKSGALAANGGIPRAWCPGNATPTPCPTAPAKLALIYRNDALGQATFTSLTQNLQLNGKALSDAFNTTNGCGGAACVKIAAYNPTAFPASLPSDVVTFDPDIVALIGTAESVTKALVPMENSSAWATPDRPYYVMIDSNRVQELLNATTTNVGLRSRVRGTGLYPTTESQPVFTSFQLGYGVRYGSTPDISGLGPSYDGMYLIAYSLAASRTQVATGGTIAQGIAKLAGGGDTINVGKQEVLKAFSDLATGNIRLVGTFSPLEFDAKGDITQGTIEMWCVSAGSGNAFGHSGLFYDTKTQSLSGNFTQCP